MRIKFGSSLIQLYFNPDPKLNPLIRFMAAQSQPLSTQSFPTIEEDDTLCSSEASVIPTEKESAPLGDPNGYLTGEAHIERAWSHWKKLGCPKLLVAPMVDNSELPFRLLCRKYGAQAAYTPMLHSRIFSENQKYRAEEFTTCKEDRPLFVQFCANDPDVLLEAARRVEPYCDYVDINFGCPQRIARRGNYGAFLMDNLPLVRSLVAKLSKNLNVLVSCKIRIFPDLQDTINYAKMLEDAGCSLLAVHGRTRDEKDGKKFRANWNAVRAVRDVVRIPLFLYAFVFAKLPIVKHFRRKAALEGSTTVAADLAAAGIRTSHSENDDAKQERLSNKQLLMQNIDYAIDLYLIYVLTLSIFPGFLYENTGTHKLGSWYAVVLIAMYNVWDLIGRYTPLIECIKLESRKGLMIAILSRFALIPAFYFTAKYGDQGWMIFLVSFLGLTNGHLTVCVLTAAPKGYKAPEQNALGNLLVLFLLGGIFSGVALDWLWIIGNGTF